MGLHFGQHLAFVLPCQLSSILSSSLFVSLSLPAPMGTSLLASYVQALGISFGEFCWMWWSWHMNLLLTTWPGAFQFFFFIFTADDVL